MCKIITIRYKCGHEFDFQLSPCLGHFSKEIKAPQGQYRKHCRLTPYLKFRISRKCGDCVRLDERKKCDKKIKKAVEGVQAAMDFLNDPDSDWRGMEGLLAELDTARRRARGVEQDCEKQMSTARRNYPCKLSADTFQLRTFNRSFRRRGSLLKHHIESGTQVNDDWVEDRSPERPQP